MCKARFESNSTVHPGTAHNPAIHVKRMEATAGKLTRDSQPLRHLLETQETVNTCRTELQYVLHTVPSDEAARGPISRRSQAGLQTVSTGAAVPSHSVSGAIMHNSTSNTNQLGSPPHNAHCRLLYWRSICHMAASVTQPHPRPPGVLPSSPAHHW